MSDSNAGSTPEQPTPPPAYEPPTAAAYDPASASPPPSAPASPPAYTQPSQGYPSVSQGYGQPSGFPSAPAYGQGVYAAAPAYSAPVRGRTNTTAIVSLIASIVGLTFVPIIGSIVGVITGHMALSQIKSTGEEGRGLALGGLIAGYVGLALTVLGILAMVAFLPAFFTLVSGIPTT